MQVFDKTDRVIVVTVLRVVVVAIVVVQVTGTHYGLIPS